jgi:hypothetical protein
MLDLDATAEQVRSLRESLSEAEREESGFEVSVTPRGRIDGETVAAYGRLGVDRLVLMPRVGMFGPGAASSLGELERFLRAHAPARLGASVSA